jgi:hypothetical protein
MGGDAMSREAMAFILGRACIDEKFLELLKKDPQAAAKNMKMQLTPDELSALQGLDFKGLDAFSKALQTRPAIRTIDGFNGATI